MTWTKRTDEEIEEEVHSHMVQSGFEPESEEDCGEYCDWLQGYIDTQSELLIKK